MNITRHIAVKLFVTVWLVYAVTNNLEVSWMHDNALALTQALIAKRTVQVQGFVSELDRDVSIREGRLYSGVPPGISLISIPFTVILTPVWKALPEFVFSDDPDSLYREVPLIEMHTYLLNMPAGAFMAVLLFWAAGLIGYDDKRRVAVAVAGTLGSMMYLYASDFFQRPLSALCLFSVFLILLRVKMKKSDPRVLWGAGFLWGMAWWFDSSAALPMAVLGLYLLSFHRGKGVLYFAGGAIPALAVLFTYNYVAWGAPIASSHFFRKYDADRFTMNLVDWIKLARPWKVWALTFSSNRGYFFYMPVMALGVVGLARWIRDGKFRAEATVIISMFVLMILLNISTPQWHGGRTFGPRYLVSTIPFLALAVGEGMKGLDKRVFGILLGVSIWINMLGALFPRIGGRGQVLHYMEYFLKYGPTPYPARLIVWKFALKRGTVSAPWDWLAYWTAGLVITACLIAVIWFIWRDRDEEA